MIQCLPPLSGRFPCVLLQFCPARPHEWAESIISSASSGIVCGSLVTALTMSTSVLSFACPVCWLPSWVNCRLYGVSTMMMQSTQRCPCCLSIACASSVMIVPWLCPITVIVSCRGSMPCSSASAEGRTARMVRMRLARRAAASTK
ncbi:hypothetical protein X945_6374 [Burkholderia pseudomallei ABCPW 107]|nr:hypothetical protein X945_6374 [Burkholderia pseudomallei ABCPW 107]